MCLIDELANHLESVEHGQTQALPWQEPVANIQRAAEFLNQAKLSENSSSQEFAAAFSRLVCEALSRGNNLHHPHYVGHQVPASVPLAALFDAIGSVTNQVMAIYEMGPWASAVETALVNRLGMEIGWQPETFAGIVTHGGSLANMTAILTARNVAVPSSWENGISASGPLPVLVVHGDVHYSVARTAGILGFGTNQLVRTKLDSRRRIDPEHLDRLLAKLRRDRRPVVAVVACACATPIGAFDLLVDVADVCRRHDVWLHVDGAHGASACLSERYCHLVAGLDLVDSIVWDAHKMLFMPALCAFVLYRNKSHQFAAFQQDAPYLFDPAAPGMAEYDSGLRTLECTKRAAAYGLWGMWSLYGKRLFADMVESTFDLGRMFYEKLQNASDFDALHEPQCNIVAFRHVPPTLRNAPVDVVGDFQLQLRRSVIQSGEFYLVSTILDKIGALRVTIINPLTTATDLDELLDTLRRHSQRLASKYH